MIIEDPEPILCAMTLWGNRLIIDEPDPEPIRQVAMIQVGEPPHYPRI
jgi:hypothetical protein